MLIEITRRGVYRGTGEMVPVGTQVEVPDGFTGWANKYRVVSSGAGKTLEVATPDHMFEEVDEMLAQDKLDALRAEYERVTGEKPHGRKKADTLREEIEEARQAGDK